MNIFLYSCPVPSVLLPCVAKVLMFVCHPSSRIHSQAIETLNHIVKCHFMTKDDLYKKFKKELSKVSILVQLFFSFMVQYSLFFLSLSFIVHPLPSLFIFLHSFISLFVLRFSFHVVRKN